MQTKCGTSTGQHRGVPKQKNQTIPSDSMGIGSEPERSCLHQFTSGVPFYFPICPNSYLLAGDDPNQLGPTDPHLSLWELGGSEIWQNSIESIPV